MELTYECQQQQDIFYWEDYIFICYDNIYPYEDLNFKKENGYIVFYNVDDNDLTKSPVPVDLSPLFLNNSWNFTIDNIILEWGTGFPVIDYSAFYKYWAIIYSPFADAFPYIKTQSKAKIDLLINSKLKYSFDIPSLWTYETFSNNFKIPIDLTKDDISIDYDIKISFGDNNDSFDFLSYKSGNIFMPSIRNEYHKINLVENESQTIILPISTNDNYESFTFEREETILEYPDKIEHLYNVSYVNNLNKNQPKFNLKNNITINGMSGVEKNHNVMIDNNTISFYDYYYYDLRNRETKQGYSNENPTYESFIFPWDYENNYGYVTSNLTAKSFSDINFIVDLLIGNKNSLRGNTNSKYYWIEKSLDISDMNNFDYIYELYIPDLSQKSITKNDINKWIKY